MAGGQSGGLRQKKHARTKLALLDSLLRRLVDRPFDDISVRELCDEVLVSEATFFNYFSKKNDLMAYFLDLWAVDVGWSARAAMASGSALAAIEAVFQRTADRSQNRPRVMMEVLCYLARRDGIPTGPKLSPAELALAFPELEDLEPIAGDGLETTLRRYLLQAVADGELPEHTTVDETVFHLLALFLGIPQALGLEGMHRLAEVYRSQVGLLWRALRAL